MGLSALLDVARTALSSTQQALQTAGHNIANVNTPGFSRQEAVFVEKIPQDGLPGQLGTGVTIETIRQTVDTFLESQLTDSYGRLKQRELFGTTLLRLQGIFADSNGQGIGPALNNFFDALQDVATTPDDSSARAVLLAQAQTLSFLLNQTHNDLTANRLSLNREINQTLTDINRLTGEIADLNIKILDAENRGQNANDFRDQRRVKVNELSQRVAITTLENQNGTLTIFVGQGQLIVEGNVTRKLVGVGSAANNGLLEVGYAIGGTTALIISSLITGGALRGLLDARDQVIPGLQDNLDSLAGALINESNQIHRLGYGLDGSTGNDFFVPQTISAKAATTNTSSATIGSGTVTAPSLLTFDHYEIRFSSPTNYSIVDTTTAKTIQGNYTGTTITPPSLNTPIAMITGTNDQITVTVDGTASGTITLTGAASPGLAYTDSSVLAKELETQINADATLTAASRTVRVTFDANSNRFIITSDSTAATSSVNVTGGTARATLGLVTGVSTAATGTFAGPQTFNLDGLSVVLNGTPAANDVFQVNYQKDAARTIAVSITDRNKIAASSTLSGIPSNNVTALALAAIKDTALSVLGKTTFTGFYGSVASDFGTTTQKAENDFQSQEFLHQQLQTFRDQTSGVSLDEELVQLIKLQRAFQAASRLIVLTDELLEELINLKR